MGKCAEVNTLLRKSNGSSLVLLPNLIRVCDICIYLAFRYTKCMFFGKFLPYLFAKVGFCEKIKRTSILESKADIFVKLVER